MKKILVVLLLLINVLSIRTEWVRVKLKEFGDPNQPVMTEWYIRGIDCSDSLNCYSVADVGGVCLAIYRSTDAGRNWELIYLKDYDTIKWKPINFTFLPRSLASPTKNKCIIGGDSGIIFKTDDGGKNWKRVYTPIFYEDTWELYKRISLVQMLDSTYGIAFCRRLFYTNDGGESWKEINLPITNLDNRGIGWANIINQTTIYVKMVCFSQSDSCPYKYTFLRTYDLGKTWEFYDAGVTENTRKMYFADSLYGWIVGGVSNGVGDQEIAKLCATTDGGRSWFVQFYDSLKFLMPFMDVSFHDRYNGIAVAWAGLTMITSDGGKTWFPDNINEDLNKTLFLSPPVVCWRNVKQPIYSGGAYLIHYRVSEPLEVLDKDIDGSEILIVPNPVENRLIIQGNKDENVTIYNSLGERIIETHTNEEIEIREFPPGVYFVRVGSKILKFVKM